MAAETPAVAVAVDRQRWAVLVDVERTERLAVADLDALAFEDRDQVDRRGDGPEVDRGRRQPSPIRCSHTGTPNRFHLVLPFSLSKPYPDTLRVSAPGMANRDVRVLVRVPPGSSGYALEGLGRDAVEQWLLFTRGWVAVVPADDLPTLDGPGPFAGRGGQPALSDQLLPEKVLDHRADLLARPVEGIAPGRLARGPDLFQLGEGLAGVFLETQVPGRLSRPGPFGDLVGLPLLVMLPAHGPGRRGGLDFHSPGSPAEVVTDYALGDVDGPAAGVAGRAADAEPELVVARAGLVGLAAADEQPLPRELLDAGEGEVLELRGLVRVLAVLAEVVDEDRRGPGLEAGLGDRLEQGADVEEVGGVELAVGAEQAEVEGIDDDHLDALRAEELDEPGELRRVGERRQLEPPVDAALEVGQVDPLGGADPPGGLLDRRVAGLAGEEQDLDRSRHDEPAEEVPRRAEREGQVDHQRRLERLLRPADDGGLARDEDLLDEPSPLVHRRREGGRSDDAQGIAARACHLLVVLDAGG
jgi:hypothetical protein